MRQRFNFILILIAVFLWAGVSQDIQLNHDQVFKELQEALTSDDWEVSYLYNTMGNSHDPDEKLADISKYDWEKIEKLAGERKISPREFKARDEKWTLVPHIAELVYKTSIRQPADKKGPELHELLQALEKSESKSEFDSWVTLKYTLFNDKRVNGINILFSRQQRPEYLITIVPDIEVMQYLTFVRPYITITKLYHDDKNRVHELAFLMVRRTREINGLIIKIFETLDIGAWTWISDSGTSYNFFMPISLQDNVHPLYKVSLNILNNAHEGYRKSTRNAEENLKKLIAEYKEGDEKAEDIKKRIEETEKYLKEKAYPRDKECSQKYEELKARWEAGDFEDTFKEKQEE